MKRAKKVYGTQEEVIKLWMDQKIPEARLRKRYGAIALYFKKDSIYSGVTYPYMNVALPWHKDLLLAKRISPEIYFMSKHKYRWCDCIKVPTIYNLLKGNKKRVYMVEDFDNPGMNISSYKNSLDRIKNKIRYAKKFTEIYHDMFKDKVYEFKSYIKDFNLDVDPGDSVELQGNIAVKVVKLKLLGKKRKYDNRWEEWKHSGYWINKTWE